MLLGIVILWNFCNFISFIITFNVLISVFMFCSDDSTAWNNTFWENVDEDNIPQLDGMVDEPDNIEKTSNISSVMDSDENDSISSNNNLSAVNLNKAASSANDVATEDGEVEEALKNIFEQVDDGSNDERFWIRDPAKELQSDIFRESMNSSLTFNSDNIAIGDDAASFVTDEVNDIIVDNEFKHVLIGDPSLTNQEIIEASSEEFGYSNRYLNPSWPSSNSDNKPTFNQNESDEVIYFTKSKEIFDKSDDLMNDNQRAKEVNLEFTDTASEFVLYPTSELFLSCINDGVGSTTTTTCASTSDSVTGTSSLIRVNEENVSSGVEENFISSKRKDLKTGFDSEISIFTQSALDELPIM